MSKWKLPDGSVIEHFEPVFEKVVNPQTGLVTVYAKKSQDGKRFLRKHVKGTAKYIANDIVQTEDGRVYRLLPPRWQEVEGPKKPDPQLVVE